MPDASHEFQMFRDIAATYARQAATHLPPPSSKPPYLSIAHLLPDVRDTAKEAHRIGYNSNATISISYNGKPGATYTTASAGGLYGIVNSTQPYASNLASASDTSSLQNSSLYTAAPAISYRSPVGYR